MTADWPTVPEPEWMSKPCSCDYPAGAAYGPEPSSVWNCPQHGDEAHAWRAGRDATLAALAPHVQPRTDDWEWGAKWDDEEYFVPKPTEAHARAYVGQQCIHGGPIIVVRRRPGRPAGEWEVAP